jgi:hypothetical protein
MDAVGQLKALNLKTQSPFDTVTFDSEIADI